MTFRVLRPYVFLGRASEVNDYTSIVEEAKSHHCGISVYVNPEARIMLATHASHLEPIVSLVSHLGKNCDFHETYFGCEVMLRSSEQMEPTPLNLMFVSAQHQPSLLMKHWGCLFWKAFRMLCEDWVFAYSNEQATAQNPIFEILRRSSTCQVPGLSQIVKHEYGTVFKRKRKYDPFKAMMAEARNQLLHARSYAKTELDRLHHILGKANLEIYISDYRFRFMLQLLETEVREIERTLQKLDSKAASIQNAVALLDEFGSVMSILKSYSLSRIGAKTDTHLLESEEIFKVEDGFVLEAYNSMGLKGSRPIVIPEKGYSRASKTFNNARVVELPISIGLRLGLLPILYRSVSKIYVEEMSEDLATVVKALAVEIGETSDEPSEEAGTTWKVSDAKISWMLQELIADLLAARIGGPAYFYALLRGFPFEQKSMNDESINLWDRLSVLRMFLENMGFALRLKLLPMELLKSDFANDSFVQRLCKIVSDLELPLEYSHEIHELKMPRVKFELIRGRVSPFEPSVVANALWESVFDRKEYLNENAAFLSILAWSYFSQINERTWEMHPPSNG